MKGRILSILIVFVFAFLTGCASGGTGDLKKEGFTELQSYSEDDAKITVFSGTASYSEAADVFSRWAENDGWSEKTRVLKVLCKLQR